MISARAPWWKTNCNISLMKFIEMNFYLDLVILCRPTRSAPASLAANRELATVPFTERSWSLHCSLLPAVSGGGDSYLHIINRYPDLREGGEKRWEWILHTKAECPITDGICWRVDEIGVGLMLVRAVILGRVNWHTTRERAIGIEITKKRIICCCWTCGSFPDRGGTGRRVFRNWTYC